jgi:hypothetical protein
METSKYDNQAIRDRDGCHVDIYERHGTMIMSADWRESGQAFWSNEVFQDRTLETVCSNRCRRRMHGSEMPFFRRLQRSSFGTLGFFMALAASLWIVPASAVFIKFQNCLSESAQNEPLQLQLVPQFVNAVFNTTDPSHNLRVTVYANVSGSTVAPPWLVSPLGNDTAYWDSNRTDIGGKILDDPYPDSIDPHLTTLFNTVNVLTYSPYNHATDFCNELENGTCPLGPVFNKSGLVILNTPLQKLGINYIIQ